MHPESRLGLAVLALSGMVLGGMPVHAIGVSIQTFMEQWDTDHDGTLSLDEVKKAADARFAALDRDHDGTLDRRKLGATVAPQQFRHADSDKDGTLDRNEYLGMVEKLFRAADQNRDGKLEKKELKTLAGRSLLRLFGSRQGPLF